MLSPLVSPLMCYFWSYKKGHKNNDQSGREIPVVNPLFLLSISLFSQSSSAVSGVSDVLAELFLRWSPMFGTPTERKKKKN